MKIYSIKQVLAILLGCLLLQFNAQAESRSDWPK